MRDPQLSSRLPKPLAINVHLDGFVSHGFAIPLDFLLRYIAATTEVTAHPLAACFGLSDLVLVGFLPVLWTFHSPYFTHSFRHSRDNVAGAFAIKNDIIGKKFSL